MFPFSAYLLKKLKNGKFLHFMIKIGILLSKKYIKVINLLMNKFIKINNLQYSW